MAWIFMGKVEMVDEEALWSLEKVFAETKNLLRRMLEEMRG